MSLLLYALLGVAGGLLAGLGIGGGIVLVTVLLYAPPLAGLAPLGMGAVAGLTAVQDVAGTATGTVLHGRRRLVSRELVLWMGVPVGLGALAGGVLSARVGDLGIMGLLAALAVAAGVAMLLVDSRGDGDAAAAPSVRPLVVAPLGLALGAALGVVGQAGSFLLIPVIVLALGVPTRLGVGSNLPIALMSALGGVVGKLGTGQVLLGPAAALALGVVPGAIVGARLGFSMPPRTLRAVLGGVILFTGVALSLDALGVL